MHLPPSFLTRLDANKALIGSGELPQLQFTQEAFFVDAFEQTWSLEAVDLDGGTNGWVAQFISFLEKRVHVSFLQEASEGNEEFCRALATRQSS